MSFTNESALIKYGSQVVSVTRGSPGSVEFNWMKLLALRSSLGGDFDRSRLAFYHVHPPGFATYSALDVECAAGFSLALGCPVQFDIILFADDDLSSLEHLHLSYRYAEEGMVYAPPYRGEGPFYMSGLNECDLAMLKALSYAEEMS